ncbi:MAG: hypothetical protein V7L04_05820 [Nostoc sp.]
MSTVGGEEWKRGFKNKSQIALILNAQCPIPNAQCPILLRFFRIC